MVVRIYTLRRSLYLPLGNCTPKQPESQKGIIITPFNNNVILLPTLQLMDNGANGKHGASATNNVDHHQDTARENATALLPLTAVNHAQD